MEITRASKAKVLFSLVFCSMLFPESSRALIFAPTDSDYLFVNGVKTTIPESDPPACKTNCETSFTLGPFDKAVIATEGRRS